MKTRMVTKAFSLLLLGSAFTSCQKRNQEQVNDPDQAVEQLVASEEWIELMGAEMKRSFKTVEQLPIAEEASFPFPTSDAFVCQANSRDGFPVKSKLANGLFETRYQFQKTVGDSKTPFDFFEEDLRELTEPKFAFLKGAFLDEEKSSYQARVRFSAKGKTSGGELASIETVQTLVWKLAGETVPTLQNDYLIIPSEWEMTDWRMESARTLTATTPLFKEVTLAVIADEKARQAIESPLHGQHLEALFAGKEIPLKKGQGRFFTTDATAQHPGLSVVDIDNDGWDDLYLCVRFGRNLLFRNQGDGTFEEVAAEYGLDLDGLSACAIFADFDNDGDQDVFIGRSLERSVYLKNIGGTFVDASSSISGTLPYLTTSMAAADYNRDGLLDIYFCTYGFAQRQQREEVADEFLLEYPAEIVREKFLSPPDEQKFLNLPGPPNMLLVNRGKGRFEVSSLNEQVETWHETLQATWADFDQDGWPDLYVCNDFAADQLYRNEEGAGFREVTTTQGHDRMRGFGMGASFGDFDNDLDLDLYVSNMFSKAGLRIIDQVGLQDERFRWSAEGNLLFENQDGDSFDFISGDNSPFAAVAQADWSWGGQFCDFDNDGFLDLYVPNGYFTAPERFAGEVDL
jgi:hypothetical protein